MAFDRAQGLNPNHSKAEIMNIPGIRWLAGSAVTAVALVAAADAAGAASWVKVSPDCEGVSLSVSGARWIQEITVRVDGQTVSFPWADVPNGEAWDSATGRVSLSPGTHTFQWADDGWDHSSAEVVNWHDGGTFTVPTCGTTTTPASSTTTTTTVVLTTAPTTSSTVAPVVSEPVGTEVEPLPTLKRPTVVIDQTTSTTSTTVALTSPPTIPATVLSDTLPVYVVPDGVSDSTTSTSVARTGRLASTGPDRLILGILLGFGTWAVVIGVIAFRLRRPRRVVNVRKP